MFIGRESELNFLEEKYSQAGGQLVVLYGRRRVGKTETLRQFCKGKPHVFFSCRECTDKMQLKAFSEKMLKEKIPAANYISEFSDWEKALRSIIDLPYGEQKRLLVIDEFPYMCKGNASIPSTLQNLWDEILKDENVMVVLCGSAMSFIEKDLLSEKNPLYGRATGIYKMTEMGFYDAVKFFPNYSDRDKVIAYSVLGGIPHYLKQFDNKLSLTQNIKKNILTKGCTLYSEVEFLLRQELRETPLYNSIIEAVALGNTKLNEISMKSLIDDTSKTSVYLKNLIELGIVQREFSVSDGVKEKANVNRGLYKLTDNFFRFWYSFVFTNFSELESGDVGGVYKYSVEPNLHEFAALAFEDICREYVRRLQRADKLPFRYSKIGRWWGKTSVRRKDKAGQGETEIDILAVSKSADKFLVGECKFKKQSFRYSEFLDVKAKLLDKQDKSEFYYCLFAESGFDKKIIEAANSEDNIYLYDLADIVSGKGIE
ncbi:MAG: ATP-binding protein [Lachnospiraceae bacterium]|nr:ATP-binding protein [Ruminococcus sp.]MCM1273794.1 ATP-binding protein [Lachnospiraceae bacterium]